MDNKIKIAIAGLGTVGVGVFKIIQEKSALLSARSSCDITINAVSSRDKRKDRGCDISNVKWYDNPLDMVNEDDIDVILELIGGEDGIAYELCKKSLQNKKHVVTANKALIAKHGVELARIADENQVALLFEASVAGGIPILKTLREGLAGNEFTAIKGIVNGTCNYILSSMSSDKRSFDDVLKEAQSLGYAETPPDLDVGGFDSAHKLAIMTAIAYGCKCDMSQIYIEGIEKISLEDIEYADELGYAIKLLGITNITDNGSIEQRVHPSLLAKDSTLANVNEAMNAVMVDDDNLGRSIYIGAGAGQLPTASSVVADIMDIASQHISPSFNVPAKHLANGNFIDINNHVGEYYLRIKVSDKAGVIASITAIFDDNSIGISKIIQRDDPKNKSAQIAIITHKSQESNMQDIIHKIEKMNYVLEKPHLIRVE